MTDCKQVLRCPNCIMPSINYYCQWGKCRFCEEPTGHTYCGPCSKQLGNCYMCGDPIKDGITYADTLNRLVSHWEKAVKESQEKLDKLKSSENSDKDTVKLYENNLKLYTEERNKMIAYRDKLLKQTRADIWGPERARVPSCMSGLCPDILEWDE